MSRRLTDPPSPSSRSGPTIVVPDRSWPTPTGAARAPHASSDRREPERRRRTPLLVAASALAVLAAAGTTVLVLRTVVGPDGAAAAPAPRATPYEAKQFDVAVAVEGGVRPLVSDRVHELETISSVTVTRHGDPLPATAYMLAPIGEERAQVTMTSALERADFVPDGRLADGRPYATRSAEAPYAALITVGAAGQHLEVFGRSMAFDELLAVTAETSIALTTVLHVPAGWTLRDTSPMPPWIDGFGTTYELVGGRLLTIRVERASAGRATLAAFGPMEPIDLGTGGWAFRHPGPVDGVLFERGDVVVEVMGSFTEHELRLIAHSVREMAPGEHPITEPDPNTWQPAPLERIAPACTEWAARTGGPGPRTGPRAVVSGCGSG